jgi:hypothetical protein
MLEFRVEITNAELNLATPLTKLICDSWISSCNIYSLQTKSQPIADAEASIWILSAH